MPWHLFVMYATPFPDHSKTREKLNTVKFCKNKST